MISVKAVGAAADKVLVSICGTTIMGSHPRDLRVASSRLEAVRDWICLRDPRGKTIQPSLLRDARTGDLRILGPFAVVQRFSITAGEGAEFVRVSRDSNPIHTEDSVVPGAMTAARCLLLPEILIPTLAVKGMRLKFRAFSRYEQPTINLFTFRPEPDGGLAVSVAVRQAGVLVADGVLSTRLEPLPGTGGDSLRGGRPAPAPDAARDLAGLPSVAAIRAFFGCLRLDPELCLSSLGFYYPRAFLAALPPGEMVRHGGAGGLLNVLDLEFSGTPASAISQEPPPAVEVEPTRPRSQFRKILARVGNGISTYCHGYATVLASMITGRRAKGDLGDVPAS